MKNIWRLIGFTTFGSLAVTLAAIAILRLAPPAVAQQPPPAAADAEADAAADAAADAEDDEAPIGAPVTEREEIPFELRQSADNNVSFPVDI
jgi:hypothetical protein